MPEIGVIGPSGRRRTEFSLRYMVHLDRAPAFVVEATHATGSATFSATDDHMAFVARWYFGFRKKARPVLQQPSIDQSTRALDRLDTLITHRERLVLWLSDNAEYDGDTLSLLLNRQPVLVAHELTKKPHRLVLFLDPGPNTLTVLAHNEGRVPPNTASCTVHTCRGRKTLLLRTGLKSSQAVVVQRE